ncbi:Atg31p NDAI_0A05850 [Naumovozyma dairenensis CBS 421]|uniref:Autophagy-related protein 31 n=1 Tax=Naumovozyma dairenensis (strain ATCC 10597 / BCRC 20456 / CBS 421 / NBRC 0211 / NRRL Y-12639) TaxID=1071378 RepID=G0W4K2_NAUDC|nr:hypothetical protein NDAI_0A05850 [Naumovozyma dairenensis CBS 421]CCD22740.1 hypothetical protein NDAI_0A05850 [Naumovozyma dairenensis CBS 421]
MAYLNVTVFDKNVVHSLTNEIENSSSPECNTNAMFPTKIKYIFEEDEKEQEGEGRDQNIEEGRTPGSGTKIDKAILGTSVSKSGNDEIENVIIIDLNEDRTIQNISLISDNYEILDYSKEQESKDSRHEFFSDDIELNVLSKFCDLEPYTKDVPLDDMVNLYRKQTEQLQILSDNI